jgi:hypothetical protein
MLARIRIKVLNALRNTRKHFKSVSGNKKKHARNT